MALAALVPHGMVQTQILQEAIQPTAAGRELRKCKDLKLEGSMTPGLARSPAADDHAEQWPVKTCRQTDALRVFAALLTKTKVSN